MHEAQRCRSRRCASYIVGQGVLFLSEVVANLAGELGTRLARRSMHVD